VVQYSKVDKADYENIKGINTLTDDLDLVTTEWSFSATGPGNPINMAAKSADVLRHQADGLIRDIYAHTKVPTIQQS
jgi:hypothetical protein